MPSTERDSLRKLLLGGSRLTAEQRALDRPGRRVVVEAGPVGAAGGELAAGVAVRAHHRPVEQLGGLRERALAIVDRPALCDARCCGTRPPVDEPDRFVNCRLVRQTLSSGGDARPGRARRLLRCGRGAGTTPWSGVCSPTPGPSSSCRAGSRRTNGLLADADVVLRGERRFDAALIARLTRCVGLVTYSVGLDGVDLDVAAAAGIAVRNVPDYCTAEVADHAVLLVLAVDPAAAALARHDRAGRLVATRGPADDPANGAGSPPASSAPAGSVAPSPARLRAFGATTIAFDPFIKAGDAELPLVVQGRAARPFGRDRRVCVVEGRRARRCSTPRRSPRSVARSR